MQRRMCIKQIRGHHDAFQSRFPISNASLQMALKARVTFEIRVIPKSTVDVSYHALAMLCPISFDAREWPSQDAIIGSHCQSTSDGHVWWRQPSVLAIINNFVDTVSRLAVGHRSIVIHIPRCPHPVAYGGADSRTCMFYLSYDPINKYKLNIR